MLQLEFAQLAPGFLDDVGVPRTVTHENALPTGSLQTIGTNGYQSFSGSHASREQ
jgi:hypothetical protein